MYYTADVFCQGIIFLLILPVASVDSGCSTILLNSLQLLQVGYEESESLQCSNRVGQVSFCVVHLLNVGCDLLHHVFQLLRLLFDVSDSSKQFLDGRVCLL